MLETERLVIFSQARSPPSVRGNHNNQHQGSPEAKVRKRLLQWAKRPGPVGTRRKGEEPSEGLKAASWRFCHEPLLRVTATVTVVRDWGADISQDTRSAEFRRAGWGTSIYYSRDLLRN